MSSQILDELADAVEAIDSDKVIVLSRTAVEKNIDPVDIVDQGIARPQKGR